VARRAPRQPGLVVVESDEDVLLYETGHIPGAVKIDWHTDLNDPVVRDYVDGAGSPSCSARKGISRDSTVVIYGDKNNWWAAYALWVFTLFGHEDVRLLDGGRDQWIAEGRRSRPTARAAPVEYPVVERDDTRPRLQGDVLGHLGNPLIDVRSPRSTTATRTTAPAYPEEGALRAGHIPTRADVPWAGRAPRTALQAACRARRDLPRRARPRGRRRRHRLLPHRRAFEPHLVRAHPPPRLRAGPQLRRLVDRVGQHRSRPDRHRHRARRGPRPLIGTGRAVSHARGGRMEPMDATTLPARLAETREDFLALEVRDRLQLLLEFSNELPELPEHYRDHPRPLREGRGVPVAGVHLRRGRARPGAPARDRAGGVADDPRLRVHPRAGPRRPRRSTRCSTCPPTTRSRSGSPRRCRPLRVRGMTGMLARVKRQVRERIAA
jgi:3-mercaptopyruvate sulfurtransferase SseA